MKSFLSALSMFLLLVMPVQALPQADAKAEALEKWQDMRFGLFIHWGPVSLKGTEIGWSRGVQVPKHEYDRLYKRFDPKAFDADAWVATAKEAGMKYLVITSKHHDGFSIFDSKYTDYDITATPFKRDVLKELSEACRRQGIQFSVYYSICDWYHPDYPTDSPGGRGQKEKHDMPRYFEFVKNQTRELIEKYGPLGVVWFDGQWEKPWTHEHGDGLYEYLMKIQPDLVINNRVGKGRKGKGGTSKQSRMNPGDFDTPEQRVGGFSRERPWETCMTLCRQWAWKPGDTMKSLKECIQTLLRVVGGDGNLLFNVGPMPDGRIEPRQVERLQEMGAWLEKYGEGVYGTRGGPFMPGRWGASTCKGDRIYLFIFTWPDRDYLKLPLVDQKVTACRTLSGGKASVESRGESLIVKVPEADRRDIATVVELTVAGRAFDIEPVRILRFGPPFAVEKVLASNVFQRKAEYAAAKAVDGDEETRWATDSGVNSAWLEVDLGEPRKIGKAWIREAYAGRVKSFRLEYIEDGMWKMLHTGTTLGEDAVIGFEPVLAQRVRLNILEAAEGPTIWEFQLF